jgi:hypothetical protein
MAFLFGTKRKDPSSLVKAAKDGLIALEKSGASGQKVKFIISCFNGNLITSFF